MSFNTLTTTLLNFIGIFSLGYGNLYPSTLWLFLVLLGIEVVLFGLYWALGGGQILDAIKKILFIGIWFWIVSSFPVLVNQFVNSLIQAGSTAAGGLTFNLLDPSAIAAKGLDVSQPIMDKLDRFPAYRLDLIIIYGILFLVVMVIFLLLAIQVFITVLEFYLIVAIVSIFLPFGLMKHTKFLAEKSIGAVISSGIKMMVLSFILSVSGPVILAAALGFDPSLNEIFSLILTVGAIGFLSWNAPGIAAGLIAGSPSLSAGTAVQNTVAGGFMAAGAAAGLANATRAAASMTGGAARLGAAAYGSASTGANLALAASSSTNPVNRAASAALGSLYGMGSAAGNQVKSTVSNMAGKAGEPLSNASTNGARMTMGMDKKTTAASTSSEAPAWAKRTMQRAASMHHSIPQEARPSGGNINPNL
ncbi:type IV secretion system protein [methanotrophic endosymbiont of Bathymodiolus puteoserpentis (Logatchev)]|jgi:type IV secretion system protein TrbL|uniref:type IV secretion system protein n=1 Tax=methanotrophic endosymbiont of Bathymodiolus puteoserpentis (Logatchev) TaxID=343235 RepID=UPI0013CD89D7|nr:type IV secretion system protein [methanotrophic endosymbiont of Bathymodiolus puteoserpentis (Logatchev)]SHE23303.1 Conjugative transfer protein TrbL [methanotrophic endosymbiont of Bathymodiolus puteoserpentis (Logatchev)]